MLQCQGSLGRSISVISEATSLCQELNIKFPGSYILWFKSYIIFMLTGQKILPTFQWIDAAPARPHPSQDWSHAKENILRQRISSLTRSTSQITVKVGKKVVNPKSKFDFFNTWTRRYHRWAHLKRTSHGGKRSCSFSPYSSWATLYLGHGYGSKLHHHVRERLVSEKNISKCYFCFYSSDGKVLVDSLKIHSDACHNCPADKEKLAVRLKGERTSEYEDGIPCLTNFLDRDRVVDYFNGSVEFDGRWKGQESEKEIELLGECFKVIYFLLLFSVGLLATWSLFCSFLWMPTWRLVWSSGKVRSKAPGFLIPREGSVSVGATSKTLQ